MPFDAREAKLLAPGQHFTISECPGLRLEATVSLRSWTYRFKSPVDQRMRQVKIGTWPAMSFNAAVVAWEKLRDIRDAGRDPAAERRTQRDKEKEATARARVDAVHRLTVRKLCMMYLEGHVDRNRSAKSAAEARRTLQRVLDDKPDFADRDPASVTRAIAFSLVESYIETPVQAGRLRGELGAVWDYGHDAGKLGEDVPNWWRQIMRGKLRSKGHVREGVAIGTAKRVLNPSEIGALIHWMPNFSRMVEQVVTLYMWTCTRGSEILEMEVHELSKEGDTLWWTVPKEKTKNARHDNATDLRVPLVGRARTIVEARLGVVKSGYLFPSEGRSGHVEQKTVSAMVWMHQPYAKTRPQYERRRLTVTHWSLHDLRRTGRTQLAALGCPDAVAEAVLGHMPTGIVGVYNLHRYDRERLEWLTRLSKHYERLASEIN
jgi:integrase